MIRSLPTRSLQTGSLFRPVFDANSGATGSGKGFGDLPEWDLTDLYPAPDAPEFDRDMEWLTKACADFATGYEGKLASLDAAAHGHQIVEAVEVMLAQAHGHAQLAQVAIGAGDFDGLGIHGLSLG